MTAWAQTLVPSRASFDRLRLGLALLLFLVLGMSGWLSWLILLWSRHVGRIEGALANHDGETMPVLARTGERDLDRIVDALNEAGNRLAEAHRRGEALAARIATSERMAALGRVAAGVAHEIRNPIASIQLKAENALAGDDERRSDALTGIIGQIARLDTLVDDLLAFTQQRQAVPRDIAVPEFLEERASEQRHAADAASVAVKIETELNIARFDPDLIARALDNLIANAIRHAGKGGTVTITAARISGTLSFTVSDTGPGVNPELRDSLFEPFVTGRPDGTGLGLAIAREAAEAHGGRLTLRRFGKDDTGGATFFLEVPWLAS
jgi:signal transduction histidine kinase